MSKTNEAAFLGISGVATGAGVASVVAALALPALPVLIPMAAIFGGIVSLGALKAGRVLDAPEETLIAGADEKQERSDA